MALVLATAAVAAQDEIGPRLRTQLRPHPRLLLDADGFARLRAAPKSPQAAAVRERLLADARAVMALPALERKLEGKRLLTVSRDALHRVGTLALAYRLTGERAYLDSARQNLRTVAAFADYNPAHFLDVAEMTTALAIGYDWLYDDLSDADRAAVREAIHVKGLLASSPTTPAGWATAHNNWNQVCNGGMSLGALAVADEFPDLAVDVVRRAVDGVPNAMSGYAPDGGYPEGPMYWEYGTTYNLLLIAALDSALGTDFGLSRQPGFLRTAEYHLHMVGPTLLNFSYGDCTETVARHPTPAGFYLAARGGDRSLLFNELAALDRMSAAVPPSGRSDPWLWLLMAWLPEDLTRQTPTATHFVSAGETPVATHRTSWGPDATFVAVKGGSPSASHAHMDVGSFCLDADGVRWAGDLGMQEYNSLESKGVDLWNLRQGSGRWSVFRLGPMSHNVLTVDGHEQRVAGHATIVRSDERVSVVDLSSVYADDLARAVRTVELQADGGVRLQDDLVGNKNSDVTVRWAVLTRTQVRIADDGSAVLTQDGKTMRLLVESPNGTHLRCAAADGPRPFDAPNPSATLVTFETVVPADRAVSLVVHFRRGS